MFSRNLCPAFVREVADFGGRPGRAAPDDVEAELAQQFVLRLASRPTLEDRYEAEVKAARASNIRLTLAIGLLAYNVFTLVDSAILPDLAWVPNAWRLGIITPVALLAMWKCTSIAARLREAYLTVMMMGAMLGPIAFVFISRAPLAPYTMLVVVLVSMFGNITIRLRFQWAVLFTFVTLIWVGALFWLKPDLPPLLAVHCFLAIVVCVSFGLFANHQLERSERRSFLLTLRERMRFEQLRADKERLSVLSRVDALTGLANRRVFDTRLAELWRRYEEAGEAFSILMIDVDFFKPYNDHYGHPAGDECLKRIGALLRDVVHERDLVARYGGEEFAVLLTGRHGQDGAPVAERLLFSVRRAAITHRFRDDGDPSVTVSVGIAAIDADRPASSAELLAIADRHLYEAKGAGRNQVFPKIKPERTMAAVA